MSDSTPLKGQRLVVVGAGARTGRALAKAASAAGAAVVLAGPDPRRLEWTAAELSGPSEVLVLDLADERSIADFAGLLGRFDHLVSTAAMPANGPLKDLELDDIQRAFSAKVIGPLLLAKHLARQVSEHGSFTSSPVWPPGGRRRSAR